jgi:GNAT superfamily N-acetyltransferase
MPELTDPVVAYLTQVDGEDHVAVVAATDSHDLKTEVGLGVARFVRQKDDPTVAEAAITVVDDVQGRGIGRLLLVALARLALARGVRVFRGEVLAENTRMRHLLKEVGASTRAADGQTLIFDVPIQEPVEALEKEPPHPLRRLLRAAAESLGMRSPADPPGVDQ